jgi:hypothetical protein
MRRYDATYIHATFFAAVAFIVRSFVQVDDIILLMATNFGDLRREQLLAIVYLTECSFLELAYLIHVLILDNCGGDSRDDFIGHSFPGTQCFANHL